LPMSARLRLDDGVELVIALVGVDATSGEFDAADPSKADYLVSRLSESSAG